LDLFRILIFVFRICYPYLSGIRVCPLFDQRLREELLVYLKENAGLKYKEIGEFDIFGDLSFVSLRSIYRNMKKNHLKA
jgi:hypothetical protein